MMVLVLLDALSVHRLPVLAPVMSDSKLLQKVTIFCANIRMYILLKKSDCFLLRTAGSELGSD